MKTMIFTDLLTTKNSLITLLGLDIILGVFLAFTMQTLIGATAAMTVIVPLMYLFSIGVYDEMNDWEGFRLTLPITRRQVVFGRYAGLVVVTLGAAVLALVVAHIVSTIGNMVPNAPSYITSAEVGFIEAGLAALAGIAAVLLAASITFPFLMRFGMTKAIRVIPIAALLLIALVVGALQDSAVIAQLDSIDFATLFNGDLGFALAVAAICAVVAALYVISSLISVKLYANREL